MRPLTLLAAATLAALTAVGCAAPNGSEDVDSSAGAAVGSMPERTTLTGPGGFVAYFDGGWAKPVVTLYRGAVKQTLRCEVERVLVDDVGATPDMRSHASFTNLRCFDAPADAADICEVDFARTVGLRGSSVETHDSMSAECRTADRVSAKQKAFLAFVLGPDAQTYTMPNKERTEPTAELIYGGKVDLALKNASDDVEVDPYAFSWRVMNAARQVLSRGNMNEVTVFAPGPNARFEAYDAKRKAVPAKNAVLAEDGKAVPLPVMVQRIGAALGGK